MRIERLVTHCPNSNSFAHNVRVSLNLDEENLKECRNENRTNQRTDGLANGRKDGQDLHPMPHLLLQGHTQSVNYRNACLEQS